MKEDNYLLIAVAAVAAGAVAAGAVAAGAVAAGAVAAGAVAGAAVDSKEYKLSIKISGFSLLLSAISFSLTYSSSIDWTGLFSWSILALTILIIEIFFLLDKDKPKSTDKIIWFTLQRKAIAAFKSVGVILAGFIGYNLVKDNFKTILIWIGYIGAGILALALLVGLIYLYLKLNSLKYGKIKNQHRKEVKK